MFFHIVSVLKQKTFSKYYNSSLLAAPSWWQHYPSFFNQPLRFTWNSESTGRLCLYGYEHQAVKYEVITKLKIKATIKTYIANLGRDSLKPGPRRSLRLVRSFSLSCMQWCWWKKSPHGIRVPGQEMTSPIHDGDQMVTISCWAKACSLESPPDPYSSPW